MELPERQPIFNKYKWMTLSLTGDFQCKDDLLLNPETLHNLLKCILAAGPNIVYHLVYSKTTSSQPSLAWTSRLSGSVDGSLVSTPASLGLFLYRPK